MKILKFSVLVLLISSTHAEIHLSDLQTTVTVQRPLVVSNGLQKNRAREEVTFEFEKAHSLLQESQNQNKPITITLPLGNNELAEFTVKTTKRSGGFLSLAGKGVPAEQYSQFHFEGRTKEGDHVRGFISNQSLVAIIHQREMEQILLESKSLQKTGGKAIESRDLALVEGIEPAVKNLLLPFQPTEFKSPTDATGFVQLRHIGLMFTLSDSLFSEIDPGANPVTSSQIVSDWVASFALKMDNVLRKQLGITIDAIGNGLAEKQGWSYIVQLPASSGGYANQPADSLFGDPSVPNTSTGWAWANHKFQTFAVDEATQTHPELKVKEWWDAGIALGMWTSISAGQDPAFGVAAVGGLCLSYGKGAAYLGMPYLEQFITQSPGGIADSVHEFSHLMGAQHTFSANSGDCSTTRFMGSAVEPGSGSTLMAYTGQCPPNNIVPFSLVSKPNYYHGKSIEEIDTLIKNLEATNICISHAPTQNRLPVLSVSNQPNANIIPLGVRFELKANVTDPDLDDQMAQDPNSVSLETKLNGAGYVNWEQMDLLGLMPGPLYRSFPPQTANYPADFQPFDYRKGYVRSFPNEATPLGTQWDPLINTPGTLHFRATAWDTNADANAGFPGFVSTDVAVNVQNAPKPEFIFPAANQTIKASNPSNITSYTITWLPNFASSQIKFASITLAYKHPWFGWKELTQSQQNAAGTLSSFSNVQFPTFLQFPGLPGSDYFTALRLEYKTLGDVTWYVESPTFQVRDEIIKRNGFE